VRVIFGADGLTFVEGAVPKEWLNHPNPDDCSVIDVQESEVEVDWVGLRKKVESLRAMRLRPTESRSRERHSRVANKRDVQASFDALVAKVKGMSQEELVELRNVLTQKRGR